MKNQELINNLKRLKNIQPSAEWKNATRSYLAILADNSRPAQKADTRVGAFGFFSSPVKGRLGGVSLFTPINHGLKFAVGFAAIVLALIFGTSGPAVITGLQSKLAGLTVSRPNQLAMNNPQPATTAKEEKVIKYDYVENLENITTENTNSDVNTQELVFINEINNSVFSSPDKGRMGGVSVEVEDNKQETAAYQPRPESKEETALVSDFKTGMIKERGYNDQVLGGFLIAGDEEK